MKRFEFAHAYVDEVLAVSLIGEVDSVAAQTFRQELLRHVKDGWHQPIVVRLDLVTRLDVAGVLALVGGFVESSARGLSFSLACV